LWVQGAAWVEQDIPPRAWLAPRYLLRGSVTVLAGVGSAGKSSLCVGYAVALALGMRFGRFEPADLPDGASFGAPRRKALLYNVEDDDDEQRRRLSAALRQFASGPSDIAGRVLRCGPASIGTLLERDSFTGAVAFTEAWHALEALLAQERPDLVVLDPLVELHTAEENDNTALRTVIAHLRGIAQRHGCAVLLVHHTRKGAEAGDMEGIRGAHRSHLRAHVAGRSGIARRAGGYPAPLLSGGQCQGELLARRRGDLARAGGVRAGQRGLCGRRGALEPARGGVQQLLRRGARGVGAA
jgi:RecA-family ATPase